MMKKPFAILCVLLILSMPMSYSLSISIVSSQIDSTMAQFSIETDEPSQVQIKYGTNLPDQSTELSDLSTTHSIQIEELQPSQTYNYEIIAQNEQESVTDSNEGAYYQFATPLDTQAPQIENITLTELSSNAATFHVVLSEPADATLFYGQGHQLDLSVQSTVSQNTHLLLAENLLNNTLYSYKLISCDSSENCAESTEHSFVTGDENDPPSIESNVPTYHNSNRLDVVGTTEPFSRIKAFVDGDLKRALDTDHTGSFVLNNIPIDTTKQSTLLRLVAVDQVGFESSAEHEILIDAQPPILVVNTLETFTFDDRFTIEGSVNEEVTLHIQNVRPRDPPQKVENVRLVDQGGNSAELEWNEVEGVEGYVIYRDGVRISSFGENFFIDTLLNRSETYEYQIAAYSDECVLGERSDPIIVPVSDVAAELDDTVNELSEFCQRDDPGFKVFNIEGNFTQVLELHEGNNIILINATDKAGNSAIVEQRTTVDTAQPVILENTLNIDSLTPSYVRHVTLTGQVSTRDPQGTLITAVINAESSYSAFPDEEGFFEIDVELERKFRRDEFDQTDYDPQRESSNFFSDYTSTWINDIQLFAEAESGLRSEDVEDQIVLSSCGIGSWWGINLGEPSPEILKPRLMLEGLAQISIPVNEIKWQGGSVRNGTINNIDVRVRESDISDADKSLFDIDYVQSPVQFMHSQEYDKGLVILRLRKLDTLQSVLDEAQEHKSTDQLTTIALEKALAEHRVDECLVPKVGCVRIPIEMEIQFSEFDGSRSYQSARASRNRAEVEPRVQRQCWDIEVNIQPPVPRDEIPEQFLVDSIALLNNTITGIDNLLTPLNTIKEVLFYGCAGSILLQFIMAFQESYNCEFSEKISAFSEGEGWNADIARMGLCAEQGYEGEQLETCLQCEDSVRQNRNFEKTLHWVCDRIFCPSAPTFQRFVKDNQQGPAPTGEIEFRSDCSLVTDDALTHQRIKDMYESYKGRKGEFEDLAKECNDLHRPSEKCCVFEYMQRWDSACLIMDELKQSKCLAHSAEPGAVDSDCTALNRAWNSVAGFCEADGTEPPRIFPANDHFENELALSDLGIDNSPNRILIAGDDKTEVYFRMLPEETARREFASDAKFSRVHAEIGYIDADFQNVAAKYEVKKASQVSSQRAFRPLTRFGYFTIDLTSIDHTSPRYNTDAEEKFIEDYNRAVEKNPNRAGRANAQRIYRDIQLQLGVVDQEYIVDPTSSILRSFQCGCLPGITSYLALWKNMLRALKICFETVLKTGDGSSGICKAAISMYVCDLIYDLIACFTKKYGASPNNRVEGGVGNFFGALTSAGSQVSNSISNRYGDSPLYRSIFSERKLVNAACLWAFTGTWDLDVNALLEEDVSIDVQTLAALYPCERSYQRFNPSSVPSGFTTYNYHFGLGMVAGSQISYRLELVCSNDFSCDTPTGQCDCANIGEQIRTIPLGSGNAIRGETVEEEIFQSLEQPYRYDKARIIWTSADSTKSGQEVCEIRDVGGDPPVYCSFDVAEGVFRCDLGFDETDSIHFFGSQIPLQSHFVTGEAIRVDLRISQRQPADAVRNNAQEENEYVKYLQYQVINQNGFEFAPSDLYYLNGNGIHELSNFPDFLIDEAHFDFVVPSIRATGELVKGEPELLSDTRRVISSTEHIVFEDATTYRVERRSSRKVDILRADQKVSQQGTKTYIYEQNTYRIELSGVPEKDDVIEVRLGTPDADFCDDREKIWHVEFTLFDKRPSSTDPSDQIVVYDNRLQQIRVPVKVFCETPNELRLRSCTLDRKLTSLCDCAGTPCDPEEGDRYCNRDANGQLSCQDQPKQNAPATPATPTKPRNELAAADRLSDRLYVETYDDSGTLAQTIDITGTSQFEGLQHDTIRFKMVLKSPTADDVQIKTFELDSLNSLDSINRVTFESEEITLSSGAHTIELLLENEKTDVIDFEKRTLTVNIP